MPQGDQSVDVLLQGVYRLSSRIHADADCFGAQIPFKLAGKSGTLVLPTVKWTADDRPLVVAPDLSEVAGKRLNQHTKDDWWYWGTVRSYRPATHTFETGYVGAVLFRFDPSDNDIPYSDYRYGRGHPTGDLVDVLFESVDRWFGELRTWIEIYSDQDLDASSPLSSVRVPGDGLLLWTEEGDTVSLPASASRVQVSMAEEESISLQLLRFLVGRVDQQAQVPDARLLLRDAVAALRRGFCRRSVIDAAAAVEIALSDAHRTQCPNIPLGTKATLGTKVKKLSSALSLPTNLKADLVDIRNDAIHNNVIPDPSSTRSALGLAEQVLHQLEPLPTP